MAKQVANFTSTYANISCRHIGVWANMTRKLRHKALAKPHDFSVTLSDLPIERPSGWLKFFQGFVQTVALFGCIAATALLWQLYFA